jgi:hypothetical protein
VGPGIHSTTLTAPAEIVNSAIAAIVNSIDRCVRFRRREVVISDRCAERAMIGSVVAPASSRDFGGDSAGNSASQSRSSVHAIRRLGRRRTVEDPDI